MYKEVAINPECMAHEEYYFLIKRETGYEKGRYLVADIKAWADEAYPYVESSKMRTMKKKSVKNFLNKLKKSRKNEHFAMPGDRKGEHAVCWFDWWEHQCELRRFDATLCEDRRKGTICIDDVIESHVDWEIPPSTVLRRDSVEIVDLVESLLNISSKLLIVDQYFSFSHNPTLVELISRLRRCNSLKSVHVVTSIKPDNPQHVYNNEYSGIMPSEVGLRVTLVPERYFHDRYLITDSGALKAGHGFKEQADQGAPSDNLSINLMSKAEVDLVQEGLKKAYDDEKATDIFSYGQGMR